MNRPRIGTAIAAAVLALMLTIAFAATRFSGLQGTAASMRGEAAPEFVGIEAWLNGDPRSLAGLRGKVALIDFWTFSCINCIRTLPHLRALGDAYGPYGLEIIGVHAPEFSFERDAANVRAAIARYEITYPVALDNQMRTWNAYRNRFWPHVYLIDAEGTIRYDHIGEGGEEELQQQIRVLMSEAGLRLPSPITFGPRASRPSITPEVYLGARRGSPHLGNAQGYPADGIVDYARPDPEAIADAPADGVFFLEGPWTVEQEHIASAGASSRLHLPFFARDVFVVASGRGRIRVLLDGEALTVGAGRDLRASMIRVDRSDLFSLVHLSRTTKHLLTIQTDPGVRLYTFTFG